MFTKTLPTTLLQILIKTGINSHVTVESIDPFIMLTAAKSSLTTLIEGKSIIRKIFDGEILIITNTDHFPLNIL